MLSQIVRQIRPDSWDCRRLRRVSSVQPEPIPPYGSVGLKVMAKTISVGMRNNTTSQDTGREGHQPFINAISQAPMSLSLKIIITYCYNISFAGLKIPIAAVVIFTNFSGGVPMSFSSCSL